MNTYKCSICGSDVVWVTICGGESYCADCWDHYNIWDEYSKTREEDMKESEKVTPFCHSCGKEVENPIYNEGMPHCQRCAVEEGLLVDNESPTPINVPLELQKKLMHGSVYQTVNWLIEMLDDDEFLVDLEEMANIRLEEGYSIFGSEMYGWDEHERLLNILEELADALVYASSGSY